MMNAKRHKKMDSMLQKNKPYFQSNNVVIKQISFICLFD